MHKGLQRLCEDDSPKGVQPDTVEIITRNRLTFWIDNEPQIRDVDLEDYR